MQTSEKTCAHSSQWMVAGNKLYRCWRFHCCHVFIKSLGD